MTQPSQPMKKSKEEINALIKDFQLSENMAAQAILVDHYTPLVGSLVMKYSKGGSFHEDLMQIGIIGLLGAIRRYDPELGSTFETFLIPTVIGEIKRYLRDKTWGVHVPRRVKELWTKIKTVVDELTNQYQRSPKVHEIADHLGVSEEEILEAMEMGKSYQAVSVDRSIETGSDGSPVTILDTIGSHEDGYEKVEKRLWLESVLHVLSEREVEILRCTFVEHKSQKETGEYLGISQMHVSRLQKKAIQKLREALSKDGTNIGVTNA
ncbi:RNA polymerase sigma factor SigB [Neobacillus drentensis]|uniref:RNA polymerase sigma factor SigB n=1 Tax=Neobacillus drentensis TaxID=220684 RepID=UPI00300008CE